jgi:methyl-accepting chemotaxis protein
MSIKTKILLLVVIPLLTLVSINSTINIVQTVSSNKETLASYKEELLKSKRKELKEHTEIVFKAAEKFYNDSMQDKIGEVLKNRGEEFKKTLLRIYENKKNTLSEQELKDMIIEVVKSYRYNNGIGYFWINDFTPDMIMHPIKPSLDGKNLSNSKDPHGKKLFVEMVEVAKSSGSGFVTYMWPHPKNGADEEKISYVFTFEPYGWIIGTGEYYSELKKSLQEKAKEVIANLRYGDSGYFWINDFTPNMIMHPIKPSLDGTNLSNSKDPHGKKLFVEMVEVCKKNGEGFVSYMWPKPGYEKPQEKISFVKSFENWGWIIGTGVYIDDINALVEKERVKLDDALYTNISLQLAIALIALILISFIAYIVSSKKILSPIVAMTKTLEGFNNDFSTKVEVMSKDEIGTIATAFNNLVAQLRETLNSAKNTSKSNNDSTKKLGSTAQLLSGNINKQFKHIEEINTLIADVGKNLDETEAKAIHTTEDLQKTELKLSEFVEKINELEGNLSEDNERQQEVSRRMQDLTTQASQVKDVLTVISDISEQTNLLAINAAIEAARAGEYGKGFAVVSDEVRMLADKTQKSLNEINTTINLILQSIDDNTQMIVGVSENMSTLSDQASEITREADTTQSEIRKTITYSSEVVHQSTYIAKKTKDLISSMNEIVELSKQNRDAGDDASAVAKELDEKSNALLKELEKFRT